MRWAAPLVFLAGCIPVPIPVPVPAPSPQPVTPAPEGSTYSGIEREILQRVNVERRKQRLDTLVWNPALEQAARLQALEMAAEHTMAHDLPGAPYPTLKDRVRHVGYSYRHVTENIAYGYPTAAYAVGAWMSSAGHRANILDRVSVETGVGVARAKSGELYFCQVFGARLYALP